MNVENDLCPHSELVKLIVGLVDLIIVNRVVGLCLNYDKHEVLFTSIQLLTWRVETATYRSQFIT